MNKKWLVQRERTFCNFWQNHIYSSLGSATIRITVTCNKKHWIRRVGFSNFLAEINVLWKYCAYNMIQKTWIIPHEAVEFLIVLTLLWASLGCQQKGAHILENTHLPWTNILSKNKISFSSKHLSNWCTKQTSVVKYHWKEQYCLFRLLTISRDCPYLLSKFDHERTLVDSIFLNPIHCYSCRKRVKSCQVLVFHPSKENVCIHLDKNRWRRKRGELDAIEMKVITPEKIGPYKFCVSSFNIAWLHDMS